LRTAVYVDGFNLYYGALKGTPYKWLDLHALARASLKPYNQIVSIKYFTARVSGKLGDPHSPTRQDVYIRALRAHIPHLQTIFGRFLVIPGTKPQEKGSDVNLAVHLLNDAWLDTYDVALVVSNDADLAGAIQLAKSERGKVVGLLAPTANGRKVSDPLRRVTDFQQEVRSTALAACQLPNPVVIGPVTLLKPAAW
jgi:uncharacterized LabA/DUF88 family protein